MTENSILHNLKESLSLEATIVGNKTYNLALLKHEAGITNVPECLTLGTDLTASQNFSMAELLLTIKNSLSYPIIARSSTNVEDSAVSFAGQFVSEVCSDDDELISAVSKIIDSAKAPNVLEYCRVKKVDPESIHVAVLFQPYLPAELSGVMFTKNPVNNNEDELVIEYKDKTTDAVTSGSAIPQIITVLKSTVRERPWPFDDLVQIGIQAEKHFGFPVDVEWIVSDERLWIVQARQITT
jgi:pyruvate,water dikinase